MVALQIPTPGTEVELKLKSFSAVLSGPFKHTDPGWYVIKGRVMPTPQWERDPDCFAVGVKGSDPMVRIVHMRHVLAINGQEGKLIKASTHKEWKVEGSKGAQYIVSRDNGKWSCNCAGFGFRKACKHVQQIADKEGAAA